jgi:hypothetical protein
MNLKLLTAATVLSTAIAAPALAQDPVARGPSVQQHQDHTRYRGHGFWPGEIAAGVVGGAIGTAGAIATAPFRNDTYAYNDAYAYNDGYYGQRYYGDYNDGFVCQPGTVFRGGDGRRHICQ